MMREVFAPETSLNNNSDLRLILLAIRLGNGRSSRYINITEERLFLADETASKVSHFSLL